MSDPIFTAMLDTALENAFDNAERADRLAYAIYGLLEGGDPEDAAQLLEQFGYTNEYGEWVGVGEE